MTRSTTTPEQFLAAFHDAHPGLTARAYGALSVEQAGRAFASSYECLANQIPVESGPRALLDLACGDGFLLSRFAARGPSSLSLTGVDLSHGELAAARRRLGAAATLHQGRAHALPFAMASFDYVVCHMALMLMDAVEVVLAEVRRVLKPGGRFAAVVGARPPPSALFDAYVALLSRYPRQTAFEGLRIGDTRLRTPEGIASLFAHGFAATPPQEVLARRRCTPRELCAWFADTYNFHMLDEAAQRDLNAQFIAAAAAHCDSNGQVEYCDRLLLITAVAT